MPDAPAPREPQQPLRAVRKPSDWSPRPIPQPVPERRTADPVTPTLKELAARERQRASLVAEPVPANPPEGGDGAGASAVRRAGAAGSRHSPLLPAQCAGAWDAVNADVAHELGEPAPASGQPVGPQPGADLVARNRRVTAAYARLYQADDRFQWAGAAAFASKQVGCGMQDARKLAGGARWDPRTTQAAHAERMLGKGNGAVFADIFPTHRFYQRHGSGGLATCGTDRPGGPVPLSLTEAFRRLDDPTEANMRASAQLIIEHEQTDILQPAVFDDAEFARTLWLSQTAVNTAGADTAAAFGARPVNVVMSAACSGATSFDFTGSDPADPTQRLPYARAVVDAFNNAVAGPARAGVDEELTKLGTGVWQYGR